jgi:chromosome segregation ATPase
MLIFNKIILSEFKCFKHAEFEFNEGYNELFAENGKGKSTIIHAIPWVLIGKDAFGKTIDNIYPLDEEQKQIPNTTPSVELHLAFNGQKKVFERTQLDGKVQYKIDGEEVKAGEYKNVVSMIASEKLLPVLLIPVYFGDNLKWQDQRDLIVSNMEIEDTAITKLDDDIALAIMKKGVDKTLSEYESDLKALKTKKDNYTGKRDYLTEKLKDVQLDSSLDELVRQKEDKEQSIKSLEKSLDSITPLQQEVNELEREIQKLESEHDKKITTSNLKISNLKEQKESILKEYKQKTSELNNIKDVCSMCGNKLNAFEIENQKAELSKVINEVKERGVTKKGEIEALESEILLLKTENVAEKQSKKLEKLLTKIQDIKSTVNFDLIQEEKTKLSELSAQISNYDVIAKDKKDFDVIVSQLSEVMDEYDEKEEAIDDIKTYKTDYAQLVADTLNAKLNKVKIITFYTQKNGELKDTFEISMDGVPYSSLNTAGKVEAGIELIEMLSSILKIRVPILIDNKESITRSFDIDNQIIAMSVEKLVDLDVQYIRAG